MHVWWYEFRYEGPLWLKFYLFSVKSDRIQFPNNFDYFEITRKLNLKVEWRNLTMNGKYYRNELRRCYCY